MDDLAFMEAAYAEALAAAGRGECPVGAVLVREGELIARAGNEELALLDPTAHAEMLCLRRAGARLGTHVLSGCTLYTTLWPCPMCQAAMLQAQVDRVVAGSRPFRWVAEVRFNSANLEYAGPIMEERCRHLFADWARRCGRREILDWEDGGG